LLGLTVDMSLHPRAEEIERALVRFGDKAPGMRALLHCLERHFGLEPPWGKAKRLRYWFSSLEELHDAGRGDWNTIEEAGRRLRKNRMTLATPQSLVKTTCAIVAEKRSKKNGRDRTRAGSTGAGEVTDRKERRRLAALMREKAAERAARAATE